MGVKNGLLFVKLINLPPQTDRMTSMKNLIVSAILKVTQADPRLDEDGEPTGIAVRDKFIRDLIAELFPECPTVDMVTLPTTMDELTQAVKKITLEEPKKKPGRKPKAKAEGVNIADLNATQKKKLKQVTDEMKVEGDKAVLLTYLNGLTPEDFDSKKFEDHIRNCFTPPKPAVEKVEAELVIVEFEGKEYYVNEDSGRVYVPKGEADQDGQYAGWEGVGYVGMGVFGEMSLE
jgi:hypothetical protein